MPDRIILHQPLQEGMLILSQPLALRSQYDGLSLTLKTGRRVQLIHALSLQQARLSRGRIIHAHGSIQLTPAGLSMTTAQPIPIHLPRTARITPLPDGMRIHLPEKDILLQPRPHADLREGMLDTPWDAKRHDTPRIPTLQLTLPPGSWQFTLIGSIPSSMPRLALPQPRNGLLAQAAWRTLSILAGTYSAGYPWFPQHWYRDLTYLLPFLQRDEQERLLSLLLEGTARLTSQPGSTIPAYDLPGLLTLSLHHPKAKWLLSKHANAISSALSLSLSRLFAERDETGLIHTPRGASWMDTATRPYPVEVQAGSSAAARLLARLTGQASWEDDARRLEEAIHTQLVKEGVLMDDHPAQPRVRPNVFLAYHLHPRLLPQAAWQETFTFTIKHLMTTPFNGLYSSISIHDPAYHPTDDGLPSQAYHHGDSWYYLNLLILRALREVIPLTASLHARPVLAALAQAARATQPAFLPEVSSHEHPRAEGAWIQLWTAAAYAWLVWTPSENHA